MRKSAFALSFLHIIIAILTHMFANNVQQFKFFLTNYSDLGDGYEIFSIVVVSIILIVSAIFPKKVRPMSFPFYGILLVLIGFLIIFTLNWS